MLRSLWFLFHILVISALLLWAGTHPGTMTITWYNQHITTDISFILCGLYIATLLLLSAHHIWENIVRMPAALKRTRINALKTKHVNEISSGLAALAAGDTSRAQRHAKAALKTQPHAQHSNGLLLLLQAQIALKQGQTRQATSLFEALSKDPQTGFLGTRALLQQALADKQYDRAKTLTDNAVKTAQKSPC